MLVSSEALPPCSSDWKMTVSEPRSSDRSSSCHLVRIRVRARAGARVRVRAGARVGVRVGARVRVGVGVEVTAAATSARAATVHEVVDHH